MQATKEDRQAQEAKLTMVFGVFLLGLAAASLGRHGNLLETLAGGVLGHALAAGMVYLWGQRTRPKVSVGWLFLVMAWAILLVILTGAHPGSWTAFGMALLLVLPLGLLARHENGIGPTVVVASGVFFALFSTGALFAEIGTAPLGDNDAVWIATASVFSVAAGTFEHERLARRTGPGTPGYWTAFRLVFITVWTIVILTLREQVQWGRLFLIFGADLTGQAGQILLIGVILAAVAVAAYAFRPQKRKEDQS